MGNMEGKGRQAKGAMAHDHPQAAVALQQCAAVACLGMATNDASACRSADVAGIPTLEFKLSSSRFRNMHPCRSAVETENGE